ncbi:MAG: dihydropteroate synthase [Saprospiraceae bacterium]|nr:dihydropteroate synthase [Saprospiraceae bacterium]
MIYRQHTLNCRGRLLTIGQPIVMGILNVTPDSFYDGGALPTTDAAVERAGIMLDEGATILDIGACSTRPGAGETSEQEELERLLPVLQAVIRAFPEALISVDTYRAAIADAALAEGVHLINDISGGVLDPAMIDIVASYGAPFICMHMQGTPRTMQDNPQYDDVAGTVLRYFVERLRVLRAAGMTDILIDPGFGFGKTVDHNYSLLAKLGIFKFLEVPIVAGVSRKSMICKVLGISPQRALNGTTALHMLALERGASVLRVHDVREAMEVIALYRRYHVALGRDAGPEVL